MTDWIAKHFTLSELTHSDTAKRNNINNKPDEAFIFANLGALATNVLDPVREMLGVPVYVTSGYRCRALNVALGGQPNSQHRLGEAADLIAKGIDCFDIAFRIVNNPEITFDQLIFENKWSHKRKAWISWIHISHCRHGNNRLQVLTSHKGPNAARMTYERGLSDPRNMEA